MFSSKDTHLVELFTLNCPCSLFMYCMCLSMSLSLNCSYYIYRINVQSTLHLQPCTATGSTQEKKQTGEAIYGSMFCHPTAHMLISFRFLSCSAHLIFIIMLVVESVQSAWPQTATFQMFRGARQVCLATTTL